MKNPISVFQPLTAGQLCPPEVNWTQATAPWGYKEMPAPRERPGGRGRSLQRAVSVEYTNVGCPLNSGLRQMPEGCWTCGQMGHMQWDCPRKPDTETRNKLLEVPGE